MTEKMTDTAAGFLAGQSACAGTIGYHEGIAPTLKGAASGTNQVPAVLYESHPNDSRVTEAGELCPTIARRWGTGGGNTPIVAEPVVESATFDWQKGNDVNNPRPSTMNLHTEIASTLNASKTLAVITGTTNTVLGFSCKDHGQDAMEEISPTLRAMNSVNSHISGGGHVAIMMNEAIPIHDQATRFSGKHGDKSDGKGNGLGVGREGDPCPTLTKGDKHAVFMAADAADGKDYAMTIRSGGDGGVPSSRGENLVLEDDSHVNPKNIYQNQKGDIYESDLTGTLAGQGGSVGQGYKAVRSGMTLRRLMPSECCILQGFPVDWCDWGIDETGNKVKMSDSTIYRMMGNAVSCPVTKFIAEKLLKVLTDIDSGK